MRMQQRNLIEDAKKCEEAGAFMIVLECVPKQLATEISEQLIDSNNWNWCRDGTDGQVLVYHDISGMESKELRNL